MIVLSCGLIQPTLDSLRADKSVPPSETEVMAFSTDLSGSNEGIEVFLRFHPALTYARFVPTGQSGTASDLSYT